MLAVTKKVEALLYDIKVTIQKSPRKYTLNNVLWQCIREGWSTVKEKIQRGDVA